MNEYQIFKSGPRKGQPRTLTDRVVRYLMEGLKASEVTCQSKKYRQFHVPGKQGWNSWSRYFIGRAGAIRSGKNARNSTSISDHIYPRMELWEAQLQATVDNHNQILENRP